MLFLFFLYTLRVGWVGFETCGKFHTIFETFPSYYELILVFDKFLENAKIWQKSDSSVKRSKL